MHFYHKYFVNTFVNLNKNENDYVFKMLTAANQMRVNHIRSAKLIRKRNKPL